MNALQELLDRELLRMTGSSAAFPGAPPRHGGIGSAFGIKRPPGLSLPQLPAGYSQGGAAAPAGGSLMPAGAARPPLAGLSLPQPPGRQGPDIGGPPALPAERKPPPERPAPMPDAGGPAGFEKWHMDQAMAPLRDELRSVESEIGRLRGRLDPMLDSLPVIPERYRHMSDEEYGGYLRRQQEAVGAREGKARELRAELRAAEGYAEDYAGSARRRDAGEALAGRYASVGGAGALERERAELEAENAGILRKSQGGGLSGRGIGAKLAAAADDGRFMANLGRIKEIDRVLGVLDGRSAELYREEVQRGGAVGVLPARYAHIPGEAGFEQYVMAVDQGTANKSFLKTIERDAWSLLPPIQWIADMVEGGDAALRGRILSDGEGREIGVYAMMTPMEIGVFGYLTQQEGAAAGQRFLDDIRHALDRRSGMRQERLWRQLADESPVLASFLSVPLNVIGGLVSSVELLGQNLNKVTGGGPVNYYSPTQRIASAGGYMRSQVAGNIAESSELGAFFYNAVMSGADSLAAAYLGPGSMAMVMLGASAGAERARELGRRGASDGQALIGGIAAGAFESFFESFSIGRFRKLGQAEFAGLQSAVRNTLASMGVNAQEEFATEIANMLWDVFADGEFSDFEMAISGYMDEGLTEREARGKAVDDMVFQSFEAAASGMLIGGMFSGVNTAQQLRNRNSARTGGGTAANPLLDLIGGSNDGMQGAGTGFGRADPASGGNPLLDMTGDTRGAEPAGAGVRYSIADSFGSDFDSWVASGKPNERQFYIGTTSEALQSIGIKDQRIVWDTSKINKIQRDHPGMSDNVLRQVPDIIESPVIVMDSKTQPNRVTMFGEVYNDSGLPVMAVLELMPTRRGNYALDTIKIANAYSKDSSAKGTQSIINDSNILYIDPNKNRTDTWLSHNQLQLPFGITQGSVPESAAIAFGDNPRAVPESAPIAFGDGQYGSIGKVSYISRDVKGNFSAEADNAPMEAWKRKLQGLSLPELPGGGNGTKRSVSGAGVLPGLSGNGIAAGSGASQVAAAAPGGRGLQGLSLPSPWSAVEKSGRDAGASREAIGVADRLSDALNVPVLFFKSPDATKSNINGYYKDGAVHVSAQGANPAAQVIAHELTHHIERAGAYNELADAVFSFIREDGGDVGRERRRTALLYERAGVNLTAAEVDAEIVAKFVEARLLTNERDIMRLAESKPSLARRILDWVEGVLAKLRGRGAEHAELMRMRGLYAKALEGADASNRSGGKSLEDTQFSFEGYDAESKNGALHVSMDGNSVNLVPYSSREIVNLHSGKNYVAGVDISPANFALDALAANGGQGKVLYFGKLPKGTVGDVANATGNNLAGFSLALIDYDVTHIMNEHGSEGSEAPRGQIPVKPENIAVIADVITNADKITPAGVTKQGKPVIRFEKRINGWAVIAEAVSDKRKSLLTKSFLIINKKRSIAPRQDVQVDAPQDSTSETIGVTASNISLPHPGDNVNAKFSIADPQSPGFDEMGRERRVDPRWDEYRRDMASLHENAPPEGMRGAGNRAALPMLSGNGIEAGGGYAAAAVPARAGESAPASALPMLSGNGIEAGGGYPELKAPGRSKVSVPRRKVMQAAERAAAKKMGDGLLEAFNIPVGSKKVAREALAEYISDLSAKRLDSGSDMRAFDALWDAGRVMSDESSRVYAEAARELRGRRIYVSPGIRAEFGDKESWNALRNAAQFRHKVVFTNDSAALPLDVAYAELANSFPGFFRAGETDARAMIEGIVEVMELSRPEYASLEDSAGMFGGDEGVQSYKRQMFGEFYDAAREYYNTVHGGRDARLDAIKAERMERMGHGGRLVDAVSEHMESKAAFAPVRPSLRREGFKGSQMMEKLGVRIANGLGGYAFTDAMLRNHEAAREISKQLDAAVRRLNPTKAEKAFALGLGDGTYKLADIPGTMDAGKVTELADYYMAKGRASGETIQQQGRDIRQDLAATMEELVPDLEGVKPPGAVLQNVSNPEKLTHRIFGFEQGEAINNEIFNPVMDNEAERKRWINAMHGRLRKHEGSDGKLRKLTKAEDALVQMVIEGQAAAEAVRGIADQDAVKNAAENVRNAKDYDSKARDDNMREFGLDKESMDLAERYAVWLEAQERLAGGTADAVRVGNAARAYRQFYDDMHAMFNEFLARHGREPIGFIPGYAPHMQPAEAINSFGEFLASVGGSDAVSRLSAAIAGRTKGFRPNMRWNPHFQSRHGDKTEYSITKGAQRYLEFGSDVIFHTADIMRVRALADHIRRLSAPEEMREMLSWAERIRNGSPAEKAEFLASNGDIKAGQEIDPKALSRLVDSYIDEAYASIRDSAKMSNYVMWLDNYANSLAGKQSMFDRGTEELLGRESLNWSGRMAQAFALSRVAGSFTTVINQFSQHANIIARTGAGHTAAALKDWAAHVIRRPSIRAWEAGSDFLADRKGIEHLADMGIWRNATEALFIPIRIVDYYNSFLAVRSRYLQETAAGKSHDDAMRRADEFARMLIGSRAKGSRPAVYESKSPVVRMVTVFQREVSQNWAYHNDLIRGREFQRLVSEHGEGKAKMVVAGTIAGTLIAAFLQNLSFDELTGVEPAQFDILGYLTHFFAAGRSMRRNDWLAMVIDNGLEELAGVRLFGTERGEAEGGFDWERAVDETKRRVSYRVPYARNIAGAAGWGDGSRPALPDLPAIAGGLGEAFSFDDVPVLERLRAGVGAASEFLPGGLQMRRSFEGIEALARGGRYRGSGDNERLQYPVNNENPLDVMRGAMFGTRGMPETGRHFASGVEGLTDVQTELVRSLVDGGADRFEAYEAVQDWRRVDAEAKGDDDADSLERNIRRHDVVRGLSFDDDLRLEFYVGLSNAEKRGEQFGELMGLGLGLDDVLGVYEEYLKINGIKGMSAAVQAASFARWVDRKRFNAEQASALKDTFRYYSHIPAEATRYESLVAAGITGADALALVSAFAGLSPEPGRSGVTDLQRYRAIDESGLTENEKVAALGSFMGTELLTSAGNPTQYAKLLDIVGTGLSVGDYLEAQGAYASINERGLRAAEKATEFSRWVNSRGFTDAQAAAVRGAFTFYSQIPAEAARYDGFVDAGLPEDVSYELAHKLMGLEPLPGHKSVTDLQRQRAVVDLVSDELGQLAAMSVLAGEDESKFRRFEVALDYGVSPEMLVAAREFARDIDENGSIDQAEARRAVDSVPGLSPVQRAALFQLLNLGWKSNPYNSRIAGRVRAEFPDDEDSKGSLLPGLSLPSLPELPQMPSLPELPSLPGLSLPSLPSLPQLPSLPRPRG